MKRWICVVSAVAVTVASIALAQAPQSVAPPPGVPMNSSTSRMVSPTVVATTMVRTLDGASSLDLMVLWRGSNGWFVKPGGRGGGGGGADGQRGGMRYASVRYAGLDLLAELDLQPRAVRIQSNPATLNPIDANVILVDDVEGPNLRVVATMRIDPAMTPDKQIEPLLKRSPEIVKFLQCDQKVDHPVQVLVERSCQSVMGK